MSDQDSIVAGIDVGGARKGLHAVALRNGALLERFASLDPAAVQAWCRRVGARAVGVDAPCRWSADGRARPAERQLMAAGIRCFATPDRERALAHPSDYFGWMLAGESLYAALEAVGFTLLDRTAALSEALHDVVFETYPQAIACAYAGRRLAGRDKARERRAVLEAAGIATAPLSNMDWVDAALCALAAQVLVDGAVRLYGEDATVEGGSREDGARDNEIRDDGTAEEGTAEEGPAEEGPGEEGTGHIVVPLGKSRIDAALIRAYRAARYVIDPGAGRYTVMVDCRSEDLIETFRRHRVRQAGWLTACNPYSRKVSAGENQKRGNELKAVLAALGRTVLPGRGEDPAGDWPGEEGVLALGCSEAELRELGVRFEQNAVLHARADAVPRLVLLR